MVIGVCCYWIFFVVRVLSWGRLELCEGFRRLGCEVFGYSFYFIFYRYMGWMWVGLGLVLISFMVVIFLVFGLFCERSYILDFNSLI